MDLWRAKGKRVVVELVGLDVTFLKPNHCGNISNAKITRTASDTRIKTPRLNPGGFCTNKGGKTPKPGGR